MTTNTVNADLYIKELNELAAVSGTTMFPVQEDTSTPEQSTFFVKISTLVTFLQSIFATRTRTVDSKTTNWTVSPTEASRVYVLSGVGTGAIQCTIPAALPVGFEFEIEDIFGKTITFVPSGATEKLKNSAAGQNFVLSSSPFKRIRVRKITSDQWNIV